MPLERLAGRVHLDYEPRVQVFSLRTAGTVSPTSRAVGAPVVSSVSSSEGLRRGLERARRRALAALSGLSPRQVEPRRLAPRRAGAAGPQRELTSALVLALACAHAGWPDPAHAEPAPPPAAAAPTDPATAPPFWISGGLHSAFLSDIADGSWQGLTFGAELKAGYRRSTPDRVGGFLQLDIAHWFGPQVPDRDSDRPFASTLQVALNIGLGMDMLYFGDRARAAFSVGPSVLLRDNAVGHAGAVGVFVDLRPIGIRVALRRGGTLVLDALTFTMLVPDLSGIPLLQLEYRTVVAIEFGVRGRP